MPWQKPQAGTPLTPNRVIQSLPGHLSAGWYPSASGATSWKIAGLAQRKKKKPAGEVQIDAEEPEKGDSSIKERMNNHSEMKN